MKATKYIVIAKHSSEQNSWTPGGDIRHIESGHNSSRAAWAAANRAHFSNGGCDGSNMLAEVMVRAARLGTKAAREIEADEYANTYEFAGWLYTEESIWDSHSVVWAGNGFGFAHR